MLARIAGVMLFIAAASLPLAFLAGCQTNAATGKSSLMLMSPQEEAQLGAEAAPQFTEQYGGEVSNAQLTAYVTEVGMKMTKQTESYFPTLDWKFTLLNSPVVNAFALPGGKVFFSRGLAEKLTNEAEMAGVLGHEMGHVTAQHGNQQISKQQIFNGGLAAAAVAVGVADENSALRKYGQYGIPALAIGGNVVLLKFSRNQELEADRLGMRYMSRVGYDPKGQLQVMQLLLDLSKGNTTPEILATHPDPEARVAQIQDLLKTEYANTQNNKDYQLYADRYQQRFLKIAKTLPPPPAPPPQTGMLDGGRGIDLDHPETWCLVCAARAAALRQAAGAEATRQDAGAEALRSPGSTTASGPEKTRPVPPREGIYAFSAPPAGR